LTIKQFTEVDPQEFTRLITFNRYQYNFLVLEANKRMAVLHISDTDVSALRLSDIGVIKTRESLLTLMGSYNARFFAEPRFEGITVSRLVLRQPFRINDVCLVFYDKAGLLSKDLGFSNFKTVPQEIEVLDSLFVELTRFSRHVSIVLGFYVNEAV